MAIRVLVAFFSLGLFLPNAYAQLDSSRREDLRLAVEKYHQSKTLGEFIAKLKGKVSEKNLKFVSGKIAGHESTTLPRLKAQGQEGFVIFLEETPIPINYCLIVKGRFSVDNKIVDFASARDMDEQWQRILSALPKSGKQNAFFNFILPQAHAQWQAGITYAIIAAGYLIYYMLDSDPCDDVIANLHGCENAQEPFTLMQQEHDDWPWEGTLEDRLAKLKEETLAASAKPKASDKSEGKKALNKKDKGKSPAAECVGTEDDDGCKAGLSKFRASNCRPSWVDKDAVVAGLTAVSTAVETLIKWKTKARSAKVLAGIGLRCEAYTQLQTCIGDLVKVMRGVCIKAKDIYKLKEALDPEATALFPSGNWVPPAESKGAVPESSTKDCPICD